MAVGGARLLLGALPGGFPRPRLTWTALGRFWLVILGCVAVLGAGLQILGPLPVKPVRSIHAGGPGPIASPDPALLEPLADDPGHFLPRIGADGRKPMAVYAAGLAGGNAPRVILIVAGIGLDHAASAAAVRDLPAGITLAVSPYARDLDTLLAAARARGDETLISLPLEPRRAGVDDPGDHALWTTLSPEENARRLNWALSRITGYVGATGALGRLRGEAFAAAPDLMAPILRSIAGRGLLYVDPKQVDVVIDTGAGAAALDARLTELALAARAHGSAIGLVGAVRPVTMARLIAWTNTLAAQGLVLAPVTALAHTPGE